MKKVPTRSIFGKPSIDQASILIDRGIVHANLRG